MRSQSQLHCKWAFTGKPAPPAHSDVQWSTTRSFVLRCAKLLTRFPRQSQIFTCWLRACSGALAFPKDIQTHFWHYSTLAGRSLPFPLVKNIFSVSVCIGTYSFSILGGCFHKHFLVFSLEFNFTHVVLRVRVRACLSDSCVILLLLSCAVSLEGIPRICVQYI